MPRSPKKTEKLEVRLPVETKQAFLARCRAEGRSASETVRMFIDSHLARPLKPKELSMILRSPFTYAGLAAWAAVGAITLTAQSSQAAPDFSAIFRTMDADGDGRVSPDELNGTTGDAPAAPSKSQGRASLSASFAEIDTNRDGGVSLAEFTAFNRNSLVRRFLALDANSDGKLTLAEMKRPDAPLGEAGSGFTISGPPEGFFAKFDRNKDGAITEDEFLSTP